MIDKAIGLNLLAGVFLISGLAGIAAFWAAWPRSTDTSPLAALFALTWGCTYLVTAILTWRRSRFAAVAFVGAIGLLMFPARYLVPGGQIVLPSLALIVLLAVLGFRYLHRARGTAA